MGKLNQSELAAVGGAGWAGRTHALGLMQGSWGVGQI
jgi:hypothetical protein